MVMTNSLLLKMAIEIVCFPMKMVTFHSYVKLPEATVSDQSKDLSSISSQPQCPWLSSEEIPMPALSMPGSGHKVDIVTIRNST